MSLWDPREHDDLLNYQFKRIVTLGGAPAIRLCEGRFGVSRTQWRLIAALVEDGPRSPSALAERSHLEFARASRLVTELIHKGLVQREEQAQAQPRVVLSATPRAHQLYAELFPQLAQINRRIVQALTEEEAALLEEFLSRLTERVEKIHAEGGGVEVRADRWRGRRRRGELF